MSLRLPTLAVAAALALLLAACGTEPPAAAAPAEDASRARVIAAIEAAGCELNNDNATAVAAGMGLPDEEIARVGQDLVREGLADVSTFGVFRLKTGACA